MCYRSHSHGVKGHQLKMNFPLQVSCPEGLVPVPLFPAVNTNNLTCLSRLLAVIGTVSLNVTLDPCARGVLYVENGVTIECQISEAFPEVTSVTWFRIRDVMPIQITPGIGNIAIDDSQRRLTITSTVSLDTATYFCQVSNGALTVESERQMLTVNSES